ncbi:MAG: HlyD family efflux transporter periplasmic adaptor subunit [bacterium]
MLKLRLIILLLLLSLIYGCAGDNEGTGGSGILEADEIVVSAETGGRVEQLNFKEGSTIAIGDTLLIIDPSKLQLQLESVKTSEKVAEAHLKSAEVNIQQAESAESFLENEKQRILSLLKSGTGTTKQLDQIEYELTQATLNAKAARTNLATVKAEIAKIQSEAASVNRMIADCYPISSINGIVTEKFIDQGELLIPGKPIAKISDLSSLYVKVYLPSEDFAKIKIGDKGIIDTETETKNYTGKVVWTSEEAEFTPKNIQTKKSRANLVYAVKIKIENSDGKLKIGMPVYITFDHD